MQITIKTLSGKEIKLTVEPDNTVDTVKSTLQEKEGIDK
jgi:hypothetical protein